MERITSLFTHAVRFMRNIWKHFLSMSRIQQSTLGAIIILAFAGMRILMGVDALTTTPTAVTMRSVSVASVASLSSDSSALPLTGKVTSLAEATIRAESSGKITVYRKLGDSVSAGQVIAEFDNAGERAQVLQVEGAYEAAKAGSDIASISRGSSDTSLEQAKAQSLNTIFSAYTSMDDAIRTKTDTLFSNPQTREAHFIVTVSDAKLLLSIEQARTTIEDMLRKREARNQTLSTTDDLSLELNDVENEMKTVRNYLDDISLALNRSIPSSNIPSATIEGFKAMAGGARSAIGGTLSSITGARSALLGSISANQIAERNASNDIFAETTSSDAQLKSALGALRGAQARLEKTIVRSPISGTINSLSVTSGDFVSPYTEVAVVSNNNALEIITYVTGEDAEGLVVGGKVLIDGTMAGTITRIASALDPKTSKIEVRIGLARNTTTLTNGSSVSISAERQTAQQKNAVMKIPLSALKITPKGGQVFTLSASSTLVAHPVTQGALLGDNIVIKDGITSDMNIVTDARGLQEGMEVSISQR